jgi:hypothetical protein
MTTNNIIPNIYIGYDSKEDVAYRVLRESILDNTSAPVNIIPLKEGRLRAINFYRRSHYTKDNINFDSIDGKPFSTAFSFTRFLVPFLNMHRGEALFMDCDMLVRADIMEVFELSRTKRLPLWCVKHDYKPKEAIKMDGQPQTQYSRKNWSSFVLWSCHHEKHKNLTIDDVNLRSGLYLHNFQWLEDEDIGEIDPAWNWLDGHSDDAVEAKNVHFTTGGPWFKDWKPKKRLDAKYALEWDLLYDSIGLEESLGKDRTIKWKKTYV